MKILFRELRLRTKRDPVLIKFSPSISYFYGKMGAGKSTIPRLIDYCLGNGLNETPALQSEFLGVSLVLNIEKYDLILERAKNTNIIIATYSDGVTKNSIDIPAKGQDPKFKLFGESISNVSDLVFVLANKSPPKVPRSQINEDSDIIRLSFRDIMWYCYLDQDNIDSSFFYLGKEENPFRQLKSRNVLMYILEQEHQKIFQIRNDLALARQEQMSLTKSSLMLKEYLNSNHITDKDTLNKEKEDYVNQLHDLNLDINKMTRTLVKNKEHPLDLLKRKARMMSDIVDQYRSGIENYDFRIEEQERLKNEFITSQLKSDRYYQTKKFFKDIKFNTCPQCGLHLIKIDKEDDCCYLCHQSIGNIPEAKYDFERDLELRIRELKESIEFLKSERRLLEDKLDKILLEKKNIDDKLIIEEFDYDSKYLSTIKQFEQDKASLVGKIETLNRLMPLVDKVDEMENKATSYSALISRLRLDLQKATAKVEKDSDNLRTLKSLFLENLVEVHFPGISEKDTIELNSKDFLPHIMNSENGTVIDFYNAGSGGKKTIFKACFALALHRLSNKMKLSLPNFLIIDTPMKNISEREDEEIFVNFYKLIYGLVENELRNIQFIIIDKEFYPPSKSQLDVIHRHMTPDNDVYPPLIPYYRGH